MTVAAYFSLACSERIHCGVDEEGRGSVGRIFAKVVV